MWRFAVFALLAWQTSVFGQNFQHVQYFDTQVLVYANQGAVRGCGVRFIGIPDSRTETVDASINVSRDGDQFFGIAKVLAYTIRISASGAPEITRLAVRQGWIRPRDGKAAPHTNPQRGDDGAAILYGVPADQAADMLVAVIKREPFLISFGLQATNFDRIYSGPLKVSAQDAESLARCVSELIP